MKITFIGHHPCAFPLFFPSFFGFFFSLAGRSLFPIAVSPFYPALLAGVVLTIIPTQTTLRKPP
jgi:hypothetical protein